MKIGTLLTIEEQNPETETIKTYRSKVVERNEHYLFIDLLIDTETNKTAFFPEGTNLKITYIGINQAVHLFNTRIIAKVKGSVPALAISLPPKEAIRTIQRRQFVRIDTATDVAVHSTNDSFTTVTADISGGGISFILPEPFQLNINERTDIWIVLQMQSGDFRYIHTKGDVIRIDDDNGVRKASLKFVSIHKKQQQSIVRYCFEKQLEARRKELS